MNIFLLINGYAVIRHFEGGALSAYTKPKKMVNEVLSEYIDFDNGIVASQYFVGGGLRSLMGKN